MTTVNRKVLRLLRTAKLCGRTLRPSASENAKSLRYNSGVAALLKHAHHLPGMMQTTNAAKQGSAAPCRIITQTFGLFRESCGASCPQQRENGRFRGSPGLPPNCAGTAGFAAPGDVSPAAKRNQSSSGSPEKHLVRKRRGNCFSRIMGGLSPAAARKRSSSGNPPGGTSPASSAGAAVFQVSHVPRPPPTSVPVDEVDELLLGVGFGLLVNPADVGPHGAFGHA